MSHYSKRNLDFNFSDKEEKKRKESVKKKEMKHNET